MWLSREWVSLGVVSVAVVFAISAATLGPCRLRIVVSDSMQPVLTRGDLVVVRRSSPVVVGDIAALRVASYGTGVISHRIVGFDEKRRAVVTKGDNNSLADGYSSLDQVEGKIIVIIPGVGNWLLRARSPWVFALFFIAPTVLLVAYEERRMRLGRNHQSSVHYSL